MKFYDRRTRFYKRSRKVLIQAAILLLLLLFTTALIAYIRLPRKTELLDPRGEGYNIAPLVLAAEGEPTRSPTVVTKVEIREVPPKEVQEQQLIKELYQEYQTDKSIIAKIVHVWGAERGREAVKVSFCESSHNPTASHRLSSAKGLYQIIASTWKGYKCSGSPLNADDNIKCAKKIFNKNGWGSSASWKASQGCHQLD